MTATTCLAGEVIIVKDSVPAAVIVLAKNASQSAKLAVKEFNYHIQKITGVKLDEKYDYEISDGESKKQTLVLIGESRFTRELGLYSNDFKRQEYLIKTMPKKLILMGRDTPKTGNITYETDGLFPGFKVIEGFGFWFPVEETGSLYAVYDFLEKFCGIRWYLPLYIGMTAVERKTLKFSEINIRRKPWSLYRAIWPTALPSTLFYWNRAGKIPEHLSIRERNLWFLRMRMGGEEFAANHSTEDWPLRFIKEHPDYFEDYCRFGEKIKPGSNMLLCYSNPGVLKQTIQDARDYFDGKLTKQEATISRAGDFFGVVPADARIDSKCSWCNPVIKANKKYFNSGETSNYIFGFVNAVAREIKKTHPDKYISALAYNGYFLPPDFELESNVAVMICVQSQLWWNPKLKEFDLKGINDWGKKAKNLYIWEYYNLPQHRKGNLFPGFSIHRLAKNIKLYHSLEIKGMFIEMDYIPGNFAWANPVLDQINLYFSLKLLDDINLDVDKMLDEFYTSYYGKAGEPIKKFVTEAEAIYNDTKKYPLWSLYKLKHLDEELSWQYLCSPEKMENFSGLIKDAYILAEKDIEKKRVKLFDEAVFQMMKNSSKNIFSLKEIFRSKGQ